MSTMRARLDNTSRRTLVAAVLVLAIGIGITVWRLDSGTAAPTAFSFVRAEKGDVIVSVGGVGRIVQTGQASEILVPAGGTGGGSSTGSGTSSPSAAVGAVPADAVFPRAAGHLKTFLVQRGQRVRAGQALALLDDGGAAAAAYRLAKYDLATALLELRQKRTSDPLKGVPPTRVELAAAELAVTSARQRLALVLGQPRRADLSAARFEVMRAEADLNTLLGGTAASRERALRVGRDNVEVARERLNRLLAPANPADISTAQAELAKAESDLAVLQRPPQGPLPEAISAAQYAVNAAQQNLADAQAGSDAAAVRTAQADVLKAQAELAALQRPAPAPLPAEITAARTAVDTARLKLVRAQAPPDRADVAAARQEFERAQVELHALESGPAPAVREAARQAVTTARVKLAQLVGPPLRTDVTAARLDVRRAEAELAALRARGGPASATDSELARLRVDVARARLASARFALGLLTVRAPSAGTVTALLTARGGPVDGTTPIATVGDLQNLTASVALSEFDAARVKRGLGAIVKVDALGSKSFRGKVRFAALTGTDNGGVVTFPVQVGVSRARGLKPGMNASVRIIVAERLNVVHVPLEAVTRDEDDRTTVDVVNAAGKVTTRRVRLGLANNKDVEIVGGLRAGERVALPKSDAEAE
jgi:RND family efflux transporter MFP subunit